MKIKWGSLIILVAVALLIIYLISLLCAPRTTCAKVGCNNPVGENGTWCEYHATLEYWEWKCNKEAHGDYN